MIPVYRASSDEKVVNVIGEEKVKTCTQAWVGWCLSFDLGLDQPTQTSAQESMLVLQMLILVLRKS